MMADPKAPTRDYQLGELCEALGVLPIDLGTLLQRYGFAIVSEADRKVLEACAALPEKQLQASLLGRPFRASHQQREFSQAELARRSGT